MHKTEIFQNLWGEFYQLTQTLPDSPPHINPLKEETLQLNTPRECSVSGHKVTLSVARGNPEDGRTISSRSSERERDRVRNALSPSLMSLTFPPSSLLQYSPIRSMVPRWDKSNIEPMTRLNH